MTDGPAPRRSLARSWSGSGRSTSCSTTPASPGSGPSRRRRSSCGSGSWRSTCAACSSSRRPSCRSMVAAGRGSIINMSSTIAEIGLARRASYAASKGAVLALTRQMQADYAAHGIRVNALLPGTIHTPFVDRYLADELRRPGRRPRGAQGAPADRRPRAAGGRGHRRRCSSPRTSRGSSWARACSSTAASAGRSSDAARHAPRADVAAAGGSSSRRRRRRRRSTRRPGLGAALDEARLLTATMTHAGAHSGAAVDGATRRRAGRSTSSSCSPRSREPARSSPSAGTTASTRPRRASTPPPTPRPVREVPELGRRATATRSLARG